MLYVPTIRRLSIDIDILCSSQASGLDRVLAAVATMPPFLKVEEDERGSRGLPKRRHFRFFYSPFMTGNPSPFVFLDVVEDHNIPHELIRKAIAPTFLDIDREVMVTLPTVESLLADKLTAFAPRTTGVPFYPTNNQKADTMQIMKQLFDIGELFNIADDLSAVCRVYRKIFDLENEYREGKYAIENALDDTFQAALSLSVHRLKGVPDSMEASMLQDGVKRLTSHLVGHRFNLDDAKVAASKAALLTRLIVAEKVDVSLSALRSLPAPGILRELQLGREHIPLDRLKRTNPEAFWYWYQASKVV